MTKRISAIVFVACFLVGACSVSPPTERELERATRGSDDYHRYKTQFHRAAKSLILNGRCNLGDFAEMGGWVRSVHRGKGMYFTYCGSGHVRNRIYLNVLTESLHD